MKFTLDGQGPLLEGWEDTCPTPHDHAVPWTTYRLLKEWSDGAHAEGLTWALVPVWDGESVWLRFPCQDRQGLCSMEHTEEGFHPIDALEEGEDVWHIVEGDEDTGFPLCGLIFHAVEADDE